MLQIITKANILIIFVIFLKFCGSTLVGVCNECLSSNNVTCIDENHFSICINGLPTAITTSCPANSVCTDDIQICRSPLEGFTPICYQDYCGNCDITNGVFSCLDETTYAYCFGENIPYEDSKRSCPDGYVCNYNFPDICVPAEMNEPSCLSKTSTETSTITTEYTTDVSTTEATTDSTLDITSEITTDSTTDTTTSEITTDSTADSTEKTSEITADSTTEITPEIPAITTTLPPRHPDDICKEIGKLGYFKSDDPTCKQYIYCYPLSGQYLGWFYYCDGYFNVATQICQVERPADCVEY